MPDLPVPLVPYPHLSTSAKVLDNPDLVAQCVLARDSYNFLETNEGDAARWRSALAWRGCQGALLYWWGELARQMPAESLLRTQWYEAWCTAYRRGRMAVGPLPWWLGNTRFHLVCQSVLLAGAPTVYGAHFVHAPLELAYLMPMEENEWQWI